MTPEGEEKTHQDSWFESAAAAAAAAANVRTRDARGAADGNAVGDSSNWMDVKEERVVVLSETTRGGGGGDRGGVGVLP